MIQILLMSFVLFLSGIVHVMDPYSFVNLFPLIIPYKLELIFIGAMLEFVFSLCLLIKKIRFLTLTCILFYFLALFLLGVPGKFHSGPFPDSLNALILILLTVWTYRLRKSN